MAPSNQAEGIAAPYSLLALSLATFAMGTGSYGYLGVLHVLAEELNVTTSAAGQLSTSFALTCGLVSPVLVVMTTATPRRRLLVAALTLFGMTNFAVVYANTLSEVILLRVLGAIGISILNPIAAATAVSLVPHNLQGRSLALVMGGGALAIILGVPSATFIGGIWGWRGTFVFSTALCFGSAVAIMAAVPPVPGKTSATGLNDLKIVGSRSVFRLLLLTTSASLALFTVVAYISPLLISLTGYGPFGVGAMQLIVGLGSVVGLVYGGRVVDRGTMNKSVYLSLLLMAIAFLPLSLLSPWSGTIVSTSVAGCALLITAICFFTLVPIQQVRLIRTEPSHHDVVLSFNGSAVLLGQGLGAAAGGITLSIATVEALGVTAALFALVAFSFESLNAEQ